MSYDILTVIWKEQKGLLRLHGNLARTLLGMGMAMLMIGVVLPIQEGRDWLAQAWSLIVAFTIPVLVVGITVPESFAGERERHTLETLLASRLPDSAILFGKLLFASACGWCTSLIVLVVSLVTANLVEWTGRFSFYAPSLALGDVAISLLVSYLVGSLGVLISFRAATVQGATQALMFTFLFPFVVLQIGLMLLLSVVPNGRAILQRALSVDLTTVILVLVCILVVLDVGLLLAAMSRFRRARLVLA